eukprot:5592834-Alexandrium_andersonii.AAC.1
MNDKVSRVHPEEAVIRHARCMPAPEGVWLPDLQDVGEVLHVRASAGESAMARKRPGPTRSYKTAGAR